jgi:putative FmdB family regulatory protein
MPIYEYKCENGHVFDVMQSMSESPLTECIDCSAAVRKVLHPVGISFKGSGFYSTDYRGGAKTETSEKATVKSGEPSTNGDGSPPSEKKPEKVAKKGE